MKELSLPDPGFTPYYDKEFFDTILHYKEISTMNISAMSIKQWYSTLMEDQVQMNPANGDHPAALIPVRPENLHPNSDWSQIWLNMRTSGSELSSFLFKLLHGLLPTQDRVVRIGMADNGLPGVCLHCRASTETLQHCFFECPDSMVVGLALLGYAQAVVPDLSPEAALLLDFHQNLSMED